MKKHPVVHFEMPADDRKRMADFYTRVFGWEAKFFGQEMGNYVTVATTDADENGRPSSPGAINGGFYPRDQSTLQNNCPSLVIAVDDINEHVRFIKDAGGRVLNEPQNIPGVGLFCSFSDTEGNICSILQPVMSEGEHASVEDEGETGEI